MSRHMRLTMAFAFATLSIHWFPRTFCLLLRVLDREIHTHVLHTVAKVCRPVTGFRRRAKAIAWKMPSSVMKSMRRPSFLTSFLLESWSEELGARANQR